MSIKTEVPVNDEKTKRIIAQAMGVAEIKEALNSKGKGVTAPGFALAVAIVDAEFAEARTRMVTEIFQSLARAGINAGRSLSVTATYNKNDEPIIEVEMPDLGDEP